jgi:hypothetical protein
VNQRTPRDDGQGPALAHESRAGPAYSSSNSNSAMIVRIRPPPNILRCFKLGHYPLVMVVA